MKIYIDGEFLWNSRVEVDGIVLPAKSVEVMLTAGELPQCTIVISPLLLELEYNGEAKIVLESLDDE